MLLVKNGRITTHNWDMDIARKTTTQNGDVVPGGASTIGWFMTRSLRVYDGIYKVGWMDLKSNSHLGGLGGAMDLSENNPLV